MRVPLEITNLIIFKGADFEDGFQLINENGTPIDLTNCQVLAKIKKFPTSKTFNTFDIIFSNRSEGIIKLLMGGSSTLFLTEGRNYFDVFVVYPTSRIEPVIRGTILVEETAMAISVEGHRIGDLGKVDTSDIQDGEVLMFNSEQQQLEFVNPDEVLDKAAEDGLPEEFVEVVKDQIDNKFDIDLGEY
ncbi:hypothetical protein b3_0327 [Synechococcus phage B3]|jgi:hypothetical protein|nr:hypothetical protein b3_0327 [Synechococcus phage B3]QGT54933.1 hypothetical protein b23_0320 [Synechococcus phage B23]